MIPQGLETLESYLEWMNEAGWYVHDMEYQGNNPCRAASPFYTGRA